MKSRMKVTTKHEIRSLFSHFIGRNSALIILAAAGHESFNRTRGYLAGRTICLYKRYRYSALSSEIIGEVGGQSGVLARFVL